MERGLTVLARRDLALAALDRGDAEGARAIASEALALAGTAGQGESLEAAALLVALAETEECLGHFKVARAAAGRAAAFGRFSTAGAVACRPIRATAAPASAGRAEGRPSDSRPETSSGSPS